MASEREKKEKIIILEEIYQNEEKIKKPKFSLKEFFQHPKRMEKFLSGGIIFFGLAAIVLGFFQIKYNISDNVRIKADSIAYSDGLPDDLLGLKNIDTDGDGISDYDEIYIYGTSPYLPDTDGDGISDYDEIMMGTDPLCHNINQNCFAAWQPEGGELASDIPFSPDYESMPESFMPSAQMSAGELRSLLINAGMSSQQLSNFSDSELLRMYQNLLSESGADISGSQNTQSNQQLTNLTPGEARSLLVGSGVSADILREISDSELMQLIQETLASY